MIPRAIKEQIDNYIDDGIPPSDFLYNLLTNRLRESVGKADGFNKRALYDIVVYLENYIPNMAWGSAERVKAWLAFHRENSAFISEVIAYDRERRQTYYATHKD